MTRRHRKRHLLIALVLALVLPLLVVAALAVRPSPPVNDTLPDTQMEAPR